MSIVQLTEEQSNIIQSNAGNIVVQALAGTGKTTTLVEFTKYHNTQKFLYLAFNKAIVDEATSKFPNNVLVKTVHSIAYNWFCENYPNKVISSFIPFAKLESFFKQKGIEINFLAVKRVNNLLKNFYSSNLLNLEEVKNDNGQLFSSGDIEKASLILEDLKSKNGFLNVTHDFYLKLYHLANIQLIGYDYILFDESQDSNDVITAIVLQQKSKKIFVGDKHQAIYQFRGSRDALTGFEKTADEVFYLTHTFRYGNNLASVASSFLKNYKSENKVIKGLARDTILNIYNKLKEEKTEIEEISSDIIGITIKNIKNKEQTCFISYKNMAILELIEFIIEHNELNKDNQIKYKLNGDLSKYNFDMIKIIYEILKQENQSAKLGKKSSKIDKIFKEKFTDTYEHHDPFAPKKAEELKTYIEKNSLNQLKDIFKDYNTTLEFCEHMEEQKKANGGDDIYKAYKLALKLVKFNKKDFIKSIENNQRFENSPHLILSTAHISKGLEWDSVILSEDLFNEVWNKNKKNPKYPVINLNVMKMALLNKTKTPFAGEFPEYMNWTKVEDEYNQQANLIYVSLTRAKKSIYIPEKLISKLKLPIDIKDVNE